MTLGGARAALAAGTRPFEYVVACADGLVALGKSDELGNDVELGPKSVGAVEGV